ncbi:MAG: DMT family transporter [Pseudomonadota bacterium]
MDGTTWAMLAALSVLWGSAFVFAEIILKEVPVLSLVAMRIFLAAVPLWVMVVVLKQSVPRSAAVWSGFLILGIFNNAAPFSLIVWGQTGTTAGLAAILVATTPLFTALIAGAVLPDERLSIRTLSGIFLGIFGVGVMIGPGAITDADGDLFHQLAVVAAALCYAIAAVFARRFTRFGVPLLTVAAGQMALASAILVPAALWIDGPVFLHVEGADVWISILGVAFLSTAVAYLIYFAIIRRAGATNAVLVTVLVPVVAVLVGAIVLGESIGAAQLAGMAFIFCGLAVIDGRLMHVLKSKGAR